MFWRKEVFERNCAVLALVQAALVRWEDFRLENPVTRHLTDAEAYLQREVFGYKLAEKENERHASEE